MTEIPLSFYLGGFTIFYGGFILTLSIYWVGSKIIAHDPKVSTKGVETPALDATMQALINPSSKSFEIACKLGLKSKLIILRLLYLILVLIIFSSLIYFLMEPA